MAKTIEDIKILKDYLTGVLDRANHHAQNVNEIALAIAGGIIWRTTDKIRVFTRRNEMKNVLWLEVEEATYCFVYNHDTGDIDVREKSIQGRTLESFNNKTPLITVKNFFENL